MSHYTGVVIESQPDWLTASAHGQANAKSLLDLGVGLAKGEQARGNKPRKWRAMGYEGITIGRVTYGQRDTAATEVRLSGDAAAEYLDATVALADRITRLDLAVTYRFDRPYIRHGPENYVRALKHHEQYPKSALPSVAGNADGGFTLYLGHRASEYYFRQYNKEAQERKQMGKQYDGRYDRCWRYELEMKASVPMAVCKKLMKAADRAEWIQGYIHTYATAHGLAVPFESAGGQELVPGFRRKSDETTKLNHLARNVRPTVLWLNDRGRGADALRALGLS